MDSLASQSSSRKLTCEDIQDSVSALSSIQDFIRWGYSRFAQSDLFYGHGTDNPWDEAVALVLQSLELPADTPESVFGAKLSLAERKLIANRIATRINQRIPLPYLTNKAYFCECEYYVDENVLIPRSPIAELIEKHFAPWIASDEVCHILDLCTGSGCIAIACGQYFPDALVDAGDISPQAIEIANLNKQKLEQDNVSFYLSDLFDSIPDKKYDIIVSNPPYVDDEDYADIPEEYLAEPKLGLVSGHDGLDLTRKILQKASSYLNDNGILVVEVGNSAAALMDSYPQIEFVWLEFARGGHGVFLLTKSDLEQLAGH